MVGTNINDGIINPDKPTTGLSGAPIRGGALCLGHPPFNRLTTAHSAAASSDPDYWTNTYSYDEFGNLTNHGTGFSNSVDTNNRFTGYCYDAAGNLLKAGSCTSPNTFTYDAENKMETAINGSLTWTYHYYPDRLRAEKTDGTNYTDYIYFGGQVIAEINQSNTWKDYVYGVAGLIAIAPATTSMSGTKFVIGDHLGSARMILNDSNTVDWSGGYRPHGLELNSGNPTNYQFTGYERDSESSLDHAWFRQYNPAQGRFMSPDPYLGSIDLADPQSINRYAYVNGNPTNYVDPLGLMMYICGWERHGWTNEEVWWQPIYCSKNIDSPKEPKQGGNSVTKSPATARPPCVGSGRGYSFGASVGIEAVAGAGTTGSSGAAGEVGGGAFLNANGPSIGGYASGGAFTRAFDYWASAVKNTVIGGPSAAGVFAGGGASFWISNAGSASQLSGPFDRTAFSAGVGPIAINWTHSKDGSGTWVVSISLSPVPGAGAGAAVSQMTTNTGTAQISACK